MKASEIVEAIERFFLDIIGLVIPGITLLFGSAYILNIPTAIRGFSVFAPKEPGDWVAVIAVSYVIGHAVTSLGHILLLPGVESFTGRIKKCSLLSKFAPKFVVPEKELMEEIEADPVFKATIDKLLNGTPELKAENGRIKVTSWRNIAMSRAPEQRQTIYKFMFQSQLNLGIATVLFLLSVAWPCVNALAAANVISQPTPVNAWVLGGMVVSLWPFLERRYRFYSPAMKVPFSIALAEMQNEVAKSDKSNGGPTPSMILVKPESIYLAGGFHSGWQDKVKLLAPRFNYFDPRGHGLQNNAEYTIWDLEAVRRCNWVFAYLEPTNPGGFALALEIGYAKALGKRVIFVDEKSSIDPQAGRYLAMIKAASDTVFDKLDDGIDFLKKLERLL